MPRKCVAVSAYKHILSMMHYYKTYRAKNKKLLLAALMLCFGTVATAQVQVKGSVFGGGNLANVGGNSSVKVSQNGAKISKDVYGGGALANVVGTATVQIDSGTVDSNVYGGGLGRKAKATIDNPSTDSAIAATVGGVVRVNIGHQAENGDYAGAATIGGEVFGCNNLNGSPKKDVYVDIWKTARGGNKDVGDNNFADIEAFKAALNADNSVWHTAPYFALQAVYGGGNEATYLPDVEYNDQNKLIRHTINVHIHGCENTVKMVYGGGRAADAGCKDDPATTGSGQDKDSIKVDILVIVDGGRIDTLFGGGDGHTLAEGHSASCVDHTPANNDIYHHFRAADIYGNAAAEIHGGLFTAAFAGSNTAGDIHGGKKSLEIDNNSGCGKEFIVTLFGGANEAVTHGDVELTVGCGVGDIGELYGGSNKAEIIDGDVTLNIRGGSFTDVFGGSRGVADRIAANIRGNVTLNLYGGTITNAFGGSDKNGNITGTITVNVFDLEENNCALHVDNIYGGGNETPYDPDEVEGQKPVSPVVNVIHAGSGITGSVYGGAKGSAAEVKANPKVNFGFKADAVVRGTQTMSQLVSKLIPSDLTSYSTSSLTDYPNASVTGNVYGGGDAAPVTGNTVVLVQNAKSHAAEVFGGGNNISENKGVSGTATVNMSAGEVTTGLYGGCNLNGIVGGDIAVNITGGTIGTSGNTTANVVFGGGYGSATKTSGSVDLTIGTTNAGPTIYGNVYGGSAMGWVNGTGESFNTVNTDNHTNVTLTNGTLDGDLYGGGLGEKPSTEAKSFSPVLVTVQGGTVNNVFGCNNANGAPQSTVAVNINTGANVSQNVYGGGNEAPAGVSPTVTINGGTVTGNVFGGGNEADVGTSDGTTLVTIQSGTVSTGVYGGCNTRGTVTGKDSVSIVGGAIGTSTKRANIYGGGLGTGTRMSGDVRVTVNNTTGSIYGDVYGGSAKGKTNCNEAGDAHEGTTQTLVTLAGGTINGNLYGGGHGPGNAEANVYGPVTVVVAAGTVDSVFGCNNVNGAPQSTDTVKINGGTVKYVFGGGNVADYGGEAVVTVNGGIVSNSIFGGGNAAGVGRTHVIIKSGIIGNISTTNSSPTNYGGVYGGCNVSGAVTGDIVVDVLGGIFGTKNSIDNKKLFNIFGGGYGSATSTTGDVTVNYGADNENHSESPKLYGDLYGGSALGSVNTDANNTTTVNVRNGSFGYYSTLVDEIDNVFAMYGGSIYGGGLGKKGVENKDSGQVNGVIHVNIGSRTSCDTSDFKGVADLRSCSVYGCNNANGSPQANVYVDVYKTMHTKTATWNDSISGDQFAIGNIYGGGNEANYAPPGTHSATTGAKTHVFIHGCYNSAEFVYGGGNAADAIGTVVEVEGGHFGDVFAGGNGLVHAANVGDGGAGFFIQAGHLNFRYEGCNMQGVIVGPKYKPARAEGYYCGCGDSLIVDTWFFGGNEAEVYEGLNDTIYCKDASKYNYKYVYGGSRHATVYGDITLVVEGGNIQNLFGGSRGYNSKPAHVRRYPTNDELEADTNQYSQDPAKNKLKYSVGLRNFLRTHNVTRHTGGNITLVIKGGTIGDVYGGNDVNGNVEGYIKVIVERNNALTDCPLSIDNIYGGSNLAKYEPPVDTITSPQVSLLHGTVGRDDLYIKSPDKVHGCVFGGGMGSNRYINDGVVTCNPKVLVNPTGGDVWVKGNIYGGGYLASVGNYTRVDAAYKQTHPEAVLNAVLDCEDNTGHAVVDIRGGTVGPEKLEMPDFRGHVFGGGKGVVNDSTETPNINYVNTTDVTIGGTAFVKGSVYGGAENGHVLDSTYVKIQGGQIGAGYNYATGTNYGPYTTWDDNTPLAECHHWPYKAPYAPYDPFASTNTDSLEFYPVSKDTTYGGRRSASDGHTFYGNVFGGGSGYFPYAEGQWLESAGVVYGNTRVEVTNGHILTNIYGGNELTDVKGTATVIMEGGTLGVPRTETQITNHPVTCYLFGGGKGDQRSRFSGYTNVDSVYVAVSGGRIYGSIFGGAEDGHVKGNVKVAVKPGAYIGMRGTSYVDGNVFGGGRGFSGEDVRDGLVQGNIDVEITGGTMLGSIYGGGRLASVGFNTEEHPEMQSGKGRITVNISGGTIGNDVVNAQYGGNVFAGSMGRLTKLDGTTKNPKWPGLAQAWRTEVTIIGDSAIIKKNVYGGGEFGFVKDSSIVNIAGGTVMGSVYGGGYGSNDSVPHKNDSVYGERTQEQYIAAFLAGRVFGHTLVNVTNGTVNGDIYGGGEMASVGDSRKMASGNTTVNIGRNNGGSYEGSATIGGNVYGANNIAGTPFGNTRVNIYKTKQTEGTDSINDDGFALKNVFGGGHQADYAPKDSTNQRAYVHVYGCNNTIRNLFGGGDAARVYGATDTIDGGRFERVFGGGNGEVTKADIGAGGTGLVVQAGIIDSLFGGSNKKGSIYGPVNTVLNHEKSSCTEQIGVFFAGSNEANIDGNLTTDIVCGVKAIDEIYGGCNLADIKGNDTLNIYGGTFHYVFAGSKGKADDAADIDGNVTLNIYGGTIDTAFGGSNVNGNITGKIEVNVEATSSCPLQLKGVYGGGKDAAHTPSVATLASPIVNIKHGTVSGDVNGGGLGTTAVVKANPKVYIGDNDDGHAAIVRNVYGGGEAGKVVGNTYVEMKNANSQVDTIFGGGDSADVKGLATMMIRGGSVKHDVYGGGALLKTDSTLVVIKGGTVDSNVYGGGLGDASHAANVNGKVTVIIDSVGTVRNVYGCNNQNGSPVGPVNVNILGGTITKNVYGGGNLADAKTDLDATATRSIVNFNSGSAQKVFGGGHAADAGFSTVNINGGTISQGVYGGCDSIGNVAFNVEVNLKGGQVGTSTNRADGVFGGGLGISTGVVNHVTVNYTNGTLYGDLYGGSSLGTVNTTNRNCTTAVNVVGGTIDGNIYGGGKGQSGQSYGQVNGKIIVNIGENHSKTINGKYERDYQGSANISGSIFGCNNAGGTPMDNVEVNVYATAQKGETGVNDTAANVDDEQFAIDQVFGGGNEADYNPASGKSITTHIYGCNNTIRRVFGGSNAAHATSVSLIIDGGRFGHVYAGGNGETTQANITQSLYMGRHGGRYGSFTVQGNNLATVPAIYTLVQDGDSCYVTNIGDYFCGNDNGSNNNPINRTIHCGEFTKVKNLYGGCNKGHQTGDITLTIEGGEIENVFGGCKGTQATPANVNGNITLTIKGGTIKNVFGGCNINGNVTGTITVNVIDGEDGNCPLILNNVYGGGREAHYQPTTAGLYPKVNIYHLKEGNSVKGNVYGGGWGSSAYVQTNPVVSIGDSNNTSNKVKVDGCIYGGGEKAEVRGNTTVNIKNASTTVDSNVFGGGNLANVTGNVDVVIGNSNAGPTINGDVYGGGALAHTGTSGNTDATTCYTNVSLYNGTVNGNVYGGGLGDGSHAAAVYSPVNVKVYGGQADTVFGCNNIAGAPQSTVNVDIYGTAANIRNALKAVFGGGNQADASVSPVVTIRNNNCSTKNIGVVYGGGNAAQVPATNVTVYGGSIDTVFGGGNGKVKEAPVAGASTVKIHGGSIGQVFGGNNVNGNIKDTISVTIEQKGEGNNPACTMEVGNVYGGGNLAVYAPSTTAASGKDKFSPKVSIISGNIVGSVYGGGKGIETSLTAGMVRSNTLVDMQGGTVKYSIYGGGELASVGDINSNYDGCKSGTGLTKVLISGGVVGDINNASMPSTTDPEGDEFGYVFAGGKGVVDSATYDYANKLALVDSTYLEISGSALITASVYGGCENGMVLRNTHVKISGGQIGTGYDVKKNKWDAAYTKEQWAAAKNAVTRGTMGNYTNPFHECDHFPYGVNEGRKMVYKVYDIFAGKEGYNPAEADTIASNGHSFYGNVFGGGSGYYPFWDDVNKKSVWRRTAGRVNGNTLVEITDSAHILTSVYGGNEYTDVLGHSTVKMSGGTLGVPRSLESIINHPVTCYLFGAGMGDPRAEFNTWTTVDSVYVEVSGGIIYGSVFGGGEDGHVKGNVNVVVKDSAFIGTWGTSYVDGNVFGGGRGFKGDVLTPGVVAGNVTVDIQGGTMLGSIYGGGRLASVGTHLVDTNDSRYGKIQDGEKYGHITINISGGTIGNKNEYIYVAPDTTIDASWRALHNLPLTEFDENKRLYHTKSGNVYGGCMGRMTLLDGSLNPKWTQLAKAKETRVNVWGNAVIKGSVYGGGEMGTVIENTVVTVSGGTIGSIIGTGENTYHYGSIFGGGYGSDKLNVTSAVDTAGLVMGTTIVYLKDTAKVRRNVFGGGDLATVSKYTTVNVTGGTVGPIDSVHLSGNVYGAGKGKASNAYKQYSNVDSARVNVSGGHIMGDVYGGGADAHVLNNTRVTISAGANIGTDGLSNYDGNVFGGGRGSGHYKNEKRSSFTIDTTCGRVGGNTYVTVTGGTMKGSLFGGGRMALVGVDVNGVLDGNNVAGNYDFNNHGKATIIVSGGRIGNPNSDALLESDFSIGDIFGSGKGDGIDSTDVLAGRVMNTQITINGNARIYGSVFGGGEMAGIGWWGADGTFVNNTGSATVTVNNCDTIGTKREFETDYITQHGDWTITNHAGRLVHSCTGNVIGGSQGDAATSPYEGTNEYKTHWVSMGRSKTATVKIEGGHILGNVYGGSEQGVMTGNTRVTVSGGTIGTKIGTGTNAYCFGSVYGGGYGSDETNAVNDSNMAAGMVAGRVYGSTQVDITGGHIYNNVYGGGSMANVGWVNNSVAPKMHTATGDSAYISWPWEFDYYKKDHGYAKVNITGGRIGVDGNENGNVYGASRGMAGDRYQMAIFGSLVGTEVNINYTSPSDNIDGDNVIVGSVYGGGENGHVYDTAKVTLRKGLVGGSLYGAGRGVDTYTDKLKNAETDVLEDVQVRDISAGKVYGNTIVSMYGGQVLKNVYGGGEMASVGKGNYHGYGEKDIDSADHRANSGKAIVQIYGGTVGTDGTDNGHVYGSSKGITFVNVTKTPRINYSRDFFLGYVNTTDVTIGKADSAASNPRIYGNVFGGGENGHVRYDTRVTVNNGEIGVELTKADTAGKDADSLINTPLWANRGNVFGAGRGTDFIPGTTDYCMSAGSVTCSTQVNINGGTIHRIVYGGGDMASVGPPPGYNEPSVCIVNIKAPIPRSTAYKDYGGYVGGGSRGLANADNGPSYANFANCANTVVNIDSGAMLNNSVYGGCEFGQVKGKAQVNVNGGSANTIYCGGNGRQGEEGYLNDEVSGCVGTTELNLLSGSVNFVYGGGRHANVTGNATVNVGKDNGDGTYSGEIRFSGKSSKVFGSNRFVGSPKGNVYVNVYKTAHVDSNSVNYTGANFAYAIPYVFGGGSEADYVPAHDTNRIYLTVYTCDNTIGNVFGGGDAAAVKKTVTVINGGRMGRVFAGGNGESKPANVTDSAILTVKGGKIGQLFGGSNQRGNVAHAQVTISHESSCAEEIDEYFGGSNEADLTGDIETTIECGTKFGSVYGGSNKADIKGDVTLNINGGEFKNVYGGSKGAPDPGVNARQGERDTAAANIDGNVTLNIFGGKIGKAFGGSNINGNITGKVEVNVDWKESSCEQQLDTVFGGSNLAAYTPTTPGAYPEVNIKNVKSSTIKAVFGGGLGQSAVVTSNPKVTIGDPSDADKRATVTNVFGGGDLADVEGTTTVLVQKSNSRVSYVYGGGNADTVGGTQVFVTAGTIDTLFGGGRGDNTSGKKAKVKGNDTISITGGRILKAFAGSNLNGDITGRMHLRVDKSGSDSLFIGEVYGGGNHAAGHAGTITIGCTGKLVTPTTGKRHGYELEGISVVYGGANEADVTSDIHLTIASGVVDSVFGGNNKTGAINGKIHVTIDSTAAATDACGRYVGYVFGGGNRAPYGDTTEVNVKAGTVDHHVFGGGNQAGVKGSKVKMEGGTVKEDVYGGCNTSGTVTTTAAVTITNGTVKGSVYGGGLGIDTRVGESTTKPGKTVIDISGNATKIGNDVYGGGNEGKVYGETEVKIH